MTSPPDDVMQSEEKASLARGGLQPQHCGDLFLPSAAVLSRSRVGRLIGRVLETAGSVEV